MTAFNVDAKNIIGEISTALIRWYPFKPESSLLFCGAEGVFTDMLRRAFHMQITVTALEQIGEIKDKFDYVVCIAHLELSSAPISDLMKLRQILTPNGILLLGMNNRLGLRYFCGDTDPYTNKVFDSIENYCRAVNSKGHMYARSEIDTMLSEAGLSRHKFYSVLPCLEEAAFIYTDGYQPKEDLTNRLFPSYNHPQSVLMEEEPIYRTLADNGMFHAMANAYLVECSEEGSFADALSVSSSLDRGPENAMITVVHDNGTVTKEAAYAEGRGHLRQLESNMQSLQNAGVPVVEGKLDDDCRYIMPYIREMTGQVYLKDLLFEDKNKFLQELDAFKEAILLSSPTHKGSFIDAEGVEREAELFDRAYPDMVPLNSFRIGDKFVFFDQEYVAENFPVNVILERMVTTLYVGSDVEKMEKVLPAAVLYDRYGLKENLDIWVGMELAFLSKLRQEGKFAEYHCSTRRDWGTVWGNRLRMDYPGAEYRRIFFDIFANIGERKLILFGSGKYAREFMDLYRVVYPVYAIVDNNDKVWGQKIHGVEVQSPEILRSFRRGECKVLICIKDFSPVMEQLDAMWKEYGVFDPQRTYGIPKAPLQKKNTSLAEKDKYNVGYVAGVFDLFHIGHLNILRRAKEHCDYLIVGVVSDRQVREYKKVEPFVPFEERLDMIRSCRYVDEAHEIPFEHPDTDMAWKLYHFDVQFSGSDYEHDPVWLKKKEWLEERGSTMVFFPYTQSTSSTRLKKLIEERLI